MFFSPSPLPSLLSSCFQTFSIFSLSLSYLGCRHPDLFDWGGDQRWNVREWGRLRGIAVAGAGSVEYEEAQFHEHGYVDQTWGVDGGVALNR